MTARRGLTKHSEVKRSATRETSMAIKGAFLQLTSLCASGGKVESVGEGGFGK